MASLSGFEFRRAMMMEPFKTHISAKKRTRSNQYLKSLCHWFVFLLAIGIFFSVAFGLVLVGVELAHQQERLADAERLIEAKKETVFLQGEIERLSRLHGQSAAQTVEVAHKLQKIIDTAKGKDRLFLMSMVPDALRLQARDGIPASAVVGMSIYESGYGKSTLSRNFNNYFGIKAFNDWKGGRTRQLTRDLGVLQHANFRAYPTRLDGIEDFANFLRTKAHYRPAFKHKTGPEFVAAVAKGGYCPDHDYATNVGKIIARHQLHLLDGIAEESAATSKTINVAENSNGSGS